MEQQQALTYLVGMNSPFDTSITADAQHSSGLLSHKLNIQETKTKNSHGAVQFHLNLSKYARQQVTESFFV